MDHEGVGGSVHFSLAVGLTPWDDPGDFVHAVTGRAVDVDGNHVGTITFKLVNAVESLNRGQRLFHVCDADSGDLEAVYSTLFDAGGEPRDGLDFDPCWHNLLYIESLENTPGPLRVQLIETAIATFCPAGLVVAVEEALALSIAEWRTLGFQRIASSPLVVRDQSKLNPYERPEPDDDDD